MHDDEAKRAILARRARFLAAAVASVGLIAGCEKEGVPPHACLSAPMRLEDAAAEDSQPTNAPEAAPLPCLSPLPTEAKPDAGPKPQICLSPDNIEGS